MKGGRKVTKEHSLSLKKKVNYIAMDQYLDFFLGLEKKNRIIP